MAKNNQFQTVIKPRYGLFDLRIKELFAYKDLIRLFVKRRFTASYKQTILGPLWAIIQPLLTSGIFTLIFGNIAGLAPTGVPTFIFYFVATIFWQFFSGSLTGTSNTFVNNSHILSKVYFPRLVMPIATICSQFISFFIQFCMFTLLWGAYLLFGTGVQVNLFALMLPLLLLQLALLGFGIGVIIAACTIKYRDLSYLVGFGTQLWMYATPIAYDITAIPEKIMPYYMLNPVTPVINTIRYGLLGVGSFDLKYYLISLAVTVFIVFIGLLLFNKVEKNFVDTL